MTKYFLIVFLFLYIHVQAQDDFKIISSSPNKLVVEYTPNYLDTTLTKINSETYRNLILKHSSTLEDSVGMPALPQRIFNVGVPNEFGNNIQILNSSFKTLKGNIKPTPNVKKVNELPQFIYTKSAEYY
ncbi:MAG: hypothetical protein KDC90_14760, partial [Ignavibacteriae bacterium]|nr:hypothetical protein [Ignavibacteriota bacterium]